MKLKPAALRRKKPTFVTAIPEGWSTPLGDLHLFHPKAALSHVVTEMYGKGAAKADGYAFLSLHGAFDVTTQTFALHVHAIVSGGMIAVFDRMRGRGRYTRAVPYDVRDRARKPIQITRKPLREVPGALTYVMQGWWPRRETYLDGRGVRRSLRIRRSRMPEPAHSEYLLWLDRWGIEDLTRMIHLRVINGKLTKR